MIEHTVWAVSDPDQLNSASTEYVEINTRLATWWTLSRYMTALKHQCEQCTGLGK